jgi:hypothetical protein
VKTKPRVGVGVGGWVKTPHWGVGVRTSRSYLHGIFSVRCARDRGAPSVHAVSD